MNKNRNNNHNTMSLQPANREQMIAAQTVNPTPISQCMKPACILRLPEVMKRVGICRASIYARIAEGMFPKQISLGARAVGWLESDIDAWLAAKITMSRPI
jgi:prophage regulatory protein